jgi:hypothetical protein
MLTYRDEERDGILSPGLPNFVPNLPQVAEETSPDDHTTGGTASIPSPGSTCDLHVGATPDPFAYERLTRFVCFAFAFWSLVLFLAYEHENRLMILILVALCLVLLYLVGSICYMVASTPEFRSSSPLKTTDSGRTGLLGHHNNLTTDIETDEDGLNEKVFSFAFEDTPRRVRDGNEMILRSGLRQRPHDGTYKVVYAAILFGKQVRTEGKLQLNFIDSSSAGWNIEGVSVFGQSTQTIQDGFVNTQGQMYWVVPVVSSLLSSPRSSPPSSNNSIATEAVLYRGIFDFDACCLGDGEFQSIQTTKSNRGESETDHYHRHQNNNDENKRKCTQGRVVRLELVEKAENAICGRTVGTEMEMATLGRQMGPRR